MNEKRHLPPFIDGSTTCGIAIRCPWLKVARIASIWRMSRKNVPSAGIALGVFCGRAGIWGPVWRWSTTGVEVT